MDRLKILVIGGTGFLGSHVADVLTEDGHDVTIYDRTPSPFIQPSQTMITGDIMDHEKVDEAVKGKDVVMHFAGIADLDDAKTRPRDTVTYNILGSINVLDACVTHKIKRFVFASSIYVYSEKGSFYRCSKQAVENYIDEYQRQYDLDYTILRYGTLFGPRADNRNSIYRYLNAAINEKRIVTAGTGDERREYIYVRDAAQLTRDILDKRYCNERITLTGHQSIYFKDMLNMICEIVGQNTVIEFTGVPSWAHYSQTPYSYSPKPGLKLTLNPYTDLGQGLLECVENMVLEMKAS